MPKLDTGKLLTAAFVVGCLVLLAGVFISALFAVQSPHPGSKDLEQVRGMGEAFALYHKKYGHYPVLVDMSASPPPSDIMKARKSGGFPACLALKLLMHGGFNEDAKCFFSPRTVDYPSKKTLEQMQINLDPRQDPTWYCTFAYDPGHNPNHGNTALFGNTHSMLKNLGFETAHVLTCELQAMEVEPDVNNAYVIKARSTDPSPHNPDNIYADDSPTLGWRDSYLQWDVPANLP